MKIFIKKIMLVVLGGLVTLAFSSCATMEAKPQPSPAFTPKTMEGGGYKIIVESMTRGKLLSIMRVNAREHDAVFFDLSISNTSEKIIRFQYPKLKLITSDGTVVDAVAAFKGGLSDPSARKSTSIYPGTKLTGKVGFPLKKTTNPAKLFFSTRTSSGDVLLETAL